MKRHILLLLVTAATCLGSFHKAEAQTAIAIDYVATDNAYATANGFDFYFNRWKINKRYQSSAADTSGNFTCKWAAVRFDSIYDINSSMGFPFATTPLRIDTIRLDVNHQKNSGSTDTLMISVVQKTGTQSGITSTDNGITWTNPVLWDTMIVTNTSLTPGLALNQVGQLYIPCYLNLPLGTKFFVKVDFTGDTVNHFYLFDYWRTDCVPFNPNTAAASESIFPLNSWRYYNMFLLPSSDLSGVAGLIYGGFPSNCNLHYFQNWGIAINAGATVPPLTANAGNDTTICSGNSVQLSASASGGTPPYQFLWNTGAISQTIIVAPPATSTYSVRVTDGLGATAVDSVTVTVNQNPIIDSVRITDVTCSGFQDGSLGYLVLTSPPLYYSWSSGQTTQSVQGLSSGLYFLTITDSNFCSIVDSYIVNEPTPINIQLTSSTGGTYPDTVCISSVSGGVPAYTYSYGGNFNPLPNNCFELLSGTFDVTVTDANVCTVTASSSCAGFQIDSITVNHVTCYGEDDGYVFAHVSGGALPYSYLWSSSDTLVYIDSLAPGLYYLTVTDANQCNAVSSVTINEPSLIQVTYTVNDVSCNLVIDGSIDLTVTGGTQPYNYLWHWGATTQDIFALAPGSYTVTITDSNSCAITETIIVNLIPQIQSNLTVTDATCGLCNGEALATVSGGAGPYTYQYFDVPPVSAKCTATFCDDLCGGNQYLLLITDASGCRDSTFFTVGFQSTLQVDSMVITNPSCIFGNNGAICAIVSGGQQPYLYFWSNNDTAACIDSLPDGIYSVTVTDAGGCSALGTATINGQSTLQVDSFYVADVTCNGGMDGALCAFVSGGPQPYDYQWSNGQTTQCLDSLSAGLYNVTVTDANLCTATGTTVIIDSGTLYFSVIAEVSPHCYGGNDGWIYAGTNGGQPPYNYLWSTGATADSIGGLSAGDYSVTVTDANQCVLSDTFTLINVTPLTAIFDNTSDGAVPDTVLCLVNNGTPPLTIDWQTGDTNVGDSVAYVYFIDGIYMPTVTDNNGCTVRDTIVIGAGCAASCVWPGDANNNGIVDNNDLLPIGLAYGATGNVRIQQDIGWYPHTSQNWADTLPSGVNYKHVDCNGNGVINAHDTLAIIQNFGLLHLKNNQRKPWRMSDPSLFVDLIPDTTYAGDTLFANLTLGDVNIPANDVYGLAFTLNYNPLVVDSSQTKITFGNSWLGTATDKISIAKDLPQNGQLKCAITRIDHTTRSGYGQIGQASFIITTDNINGKNMLEYFAMNVWISDLTVIDNYGNVMTVNEGADSAQVEFEPSSVRHQTLSIGTLTIQPNPANNEVSLSFSNNLLGGELKLLDVEGSMILSKTIHTVTEKINISSYANGIYVVQVITEKGVLIKRLAVAR
jgi:hypothetical protein